MQVTGTEWPASVGDDTTELRVFSPKGTVVQSISTPCSSIGGSTSGKYITGFKTLAGFVYFSTQVSFVFKNRSPWLAFGRLPALSKLIVILCRCAIG